MKLVEVSMNTQAAQNRSKFHRLARMIFEWINEGIGETLLRQRLMTRAPADVDVTEEGATVICFGLQTPPARSIYQAIINWAHMAETA